MSNNAILLSVRPQYANQIFKGKKKVELRRVCPKHIKKNDLVLIYVSSPVKSLCGAFRVDKVVEKSLPELWKMVKNKAGITRKEFDAYYDGVSVGTGIFFDEVRPLPKPIELHELKKEMAGFQPPQSFRYATADELSSPDLAGFIELFPFKPLGRKLFKQSMLPQK